MGERLTTFGAKTGTATEAKILAFLAAAEYFARTEAWAATCADADFFEADY